MLFPDLTRKPSEATVQTLTNHHLLQLLNDPSAWILLPTTREEKNLAYDAGFKNVQVAVIQYKRVSRINKDESITVRIDKNQHEQLLRNFSHFRRPCAFYCFSDYRSYEQINKDYGRIGSPEFFRHSIFFDIRELLEFCCTVRLFRNGRLVPIARKEHPIYYLRGPEFINQVQSLEIGLSYDTQQTLVQPDAGVSNSFQLWLGTTNSHYSVLYRQLPQSGLRQELVRTR